MSQIKYLGERVIDVKETKYKDYSPQDWVIHYIESYGQIDGSHHKQWVMDQVVRILKGTPVIVRLAEWDNGLKELRVKTGEPSAEYLKWVEEMKGKFDEEEDDYLYDYDEGIAP